MVTAGHFRFAVLAREVGWTHTSIGTLAGVEAGAAILAGAMVGAEVEVLVAEQSAPALFTVTLEGLVAGALMAAGVLDAAITMGSFPSEAAPVYGKALRYFMARET